MKAPQYPWHYQERDLLPLRGGRRRKSDMKCVNEKCTKDPLASLGRTFVTIDGDAACCQACAEEYYKQRDHFFKDIMPNARKTMDWLNGREE